MIKTYNDLILACDNFGYSREYYEMMKEAAEIDLMNIYVANQEYMAENADLIQESADVLDDYFQEATGFDRVKSVAANAAGKTANLAKKIWAKIKQVLRAIVNFFRKLTGRTEQHMARLQAYNELVGLKKSDIPGAAAVVDKYEAKLKELDIIVLDANGRPIRFSQKAGKNDNRIKVMQKMIASILNAKAVNIKSMKGNIADADKLANLMKAVMHNSSEASTMLKNLATSPKTTVPLHEDKIKKQMEVIENIIKEMEKMFDNDVEKFYGQIGTSTKDRAADRVTILNKAMEYAGNTLHAYSDVDKLLATLAQFATEYKKFVSENQPKEKPAPVESWSVPSMRAQ